MTKISSPPTTKPDPATVPEGPVRTSRRVFSWGTLTEVFVENVKVGFVDAYADDGSVIAYSNRLGFVQEVKSVKAGTMLLVKKHAQQSPPPPGQ